MKVLFIGGTGTISSACTRLALEQGVELYIFNRGQTSTDLPAGAHLLQGDINNRDEAAALLADHTFDAVVADLYAGRSPLARGAQGDHGNLPAHGTLGRLRQHIPDDRRAGVVPPEEAGEEPVWLRTTPATAPSAATSTTRAPDA